LTTPLQRIPHLMANAIRHMSKVSKIPNPFTRISRMHKVQRYSRKRDDTHQVFKKSTQAPATCNHALKPPFGILLILFTLSGLLLTLLRILLKGRPSMPPLSAKSRSSSSLGSSSSWASRSESQAFRRSHCLFQRCHGLVLGLGGLMAVTRLSLDLEPERLVRLVIDFPALSLLRPNNTGDRK